MLAKADGISNGSVQRILAEHGLKQHLTRTFKVSSEFAARVKYIVGLYLDPPHKAIELSVDEKSQRQALDRTQPGLPMTKGRVGTMTHDYKCHGTTTLFAGLDVNTGEVIGEYLPRRRATEFISFLKKNDGIVAKQLDVHLVLGPQDRQIQGMAREASPLLDALRPDLRLLAQYGRAAVRRDHAPTHSARRLQQRRRVQGRHQGLA